MVGVCGWERPLTSWHTKLSGRWRRSSGDFARLLCCTALLLQHKRARLLLVIVIVMLLCCNVVMLLCLCCYVVIVIVIVIVGIVVATQAWQVITAAGDECWVRRRGTSPV